jgi:hypothetical protein
VEVVPLETVGEDIVYRGIDKRGFGGNGGGVAGLGKGLYTTNSKEEAQKYAWEDGRTKGKPVALKNAKPINSLVLNDGNVQKWIDENLPKSKYKNESDFRDNLSEYVTGLGYDGITIKSSDGVEIYVKYTEQSLKETKAEEVKSEVAIPKSFTSEGDNKVVDNEGNPLVVYHGTQSNFKDFEIPSNFGKVGYATSGGFEMGMAGGAIYFSSNEDTAKSYSSLDKRKKGRVIKSFIDIKKPYIIDAKGGNWTGRIADEYKIGLKNKDYDGVIVKNVIDSAATGGVVGDVYAVKSPSQIIQIAEPTPAKPKATKLKAKVDTRLKFKEVSDLSTKINEAVKGSAKRKRLIADRNLLLEKFPIIKYVYENIQNITKQLIQKGIITKDKDKVTYNGVNYSSDEFSSLLHDGLLDQLVKDKIIDDSNFVKKAEAIERTEFDSEEEAELYGISRETDPNVIAAKYFTLPTLEESSSPKDLILMEHFSGKRSSKINESDWAEYNDLNNLTPEIRKKYIDSTNKSGRLDTEALSYEENEGISFAPEDFIDFILDYGGAKGFKSKKVSNIQQALLERYFDLTGRKQITDAAAKKAFETISEENKIAEKRYTQKQRLEEAGITEEDIAKEQEFAKEGFGELETPLEKFEYQKKQISKKGKTELEINKEIFAKAKEMAAAIRGAKIDGKGKAFDATLGLPVAIWNGAIETVASAIEAGVAVADAIKRGLNYIQKNNRGQWNKKAYNDRVIAELGLRGIEVNGEDLIVQPLEDKATVELVNGFYSPLEKGIAEAKTDKATGKGWMKVLSGVTEADELNYTGVKDFLNSNADRPISRKELLDYMKDNRIEVVEVVLGVAKGADILNEEQLKRLDELEKLDAKYPSGAIEDIEAGSYDEFLYLLNVRDKSSSEDLIRLQRDSERKAQLAQRSGDKKLAEKYWNDSHRYTARHEALELSEEGAGGISNPTKFSQYQLEGEKENYKELLVTLPSRTPLTFEQFKLRAQKETSMDDYEVKAAYKNYITKGDFSKLAPNQFKSSHFDEPNILVHLRMNTRTDAEGNKVLFIEEVQSDWGQKGKKEGFIDNEKLPNKTFIDYRQELFEKYNTEKYNDLIKLTTQNEKSNLERLFAKENGQENLLKTVPTAPFVTDTNAWTKLGLKTALKEAVAQGADKLAWTTGEQQNDRYDLSKQVDEINYSKNSDGTYDISANKNDNQVFNKSFIKENELEGLVGKDVAKKIINDEGKEPVRGSGNYKKSLSGEGLKVGGKGMKGFYGSPTEESKGIIGGLAEKLFGQKLGTVEINKGTDGLTKDEALKLLNQGEKIYTYSRGTMYRLYDIHDINEATNYFSKKGEATSTQYSIDITPELKQAVKEGIPLFKNELTQAKEKLKEASAALSKLNKNLGIYSDPEQNARALFEYHKALVGVAKAYIKEIVKSGLANIKLDIKDFAEEIGENITQEVKDAWNEANGKGKKTLSDFKEEAEKLQAKEEKERLRQEDLGLVTPKLEDYESEEPIKVSNDFESLAYQAIESKEFRNTLSNKERESGRQLTRAEKRYQANPFMDSFELGKRIVAKAKEELGDTYVNDLLSYIAKNQNTLGVDKVSLIMLTLENDLNRQLQEDPDNLTLKKQENMVQNLAISYLRSAARAIGYGKLRQIARVGYDVDEVTSQLFSSGQEESRRKVVKAMQSTADEINNEAELQEQETEGELVIEEPKVKRDAKQVRADIKAVIAQMKADLVKSARGAGGALSAIPYAQQVKDVTPHIIKLSKLFAELGGMKTKEIVAEIRKSIKGLAPDVDETTITDILKEGKRILTEEQKRKNYIKSLEKDINDLDTQIEEKKRKVVSKEDKYKNDEEIQNLRDIKNGKKDLLNTLDPSYAERVKLKNDLNAAQRSLEEYERKIAENDFETAKKPIQQDIDSKLKELRDKRDTARNEYQDKKKAFEASLITPESIEEKNIDKAIKATEKSIAELERKLAEGDVTVTPKGQSPYSKQLGELKQKQAQLRDKLIEERNKAIGKSAPKDRLEQAKDRVNKRIEQLKEEIADKRKELKVVGKVKSDAELDSLLEQEKELKKIANQYLTQESIDRINESKEKSIVTKIENEIAKLDEQIANQQKLPKSSSSPVTSLEITLLKAQRKARIDVLNELDPNPKAFTKQALIDAGYSREITVTRKGGIKEKIQVLDWKKLAGNEMDVNAIKNIVEQALKDKGFTPAQISRMQDAFVNEFTELRASVIDKSLNTLRQMNEPKKVSERKSSAKRLAELFDFGLFNQDPDKFNYLLNKILGLSDLDQESFFELNKLSESIKEINLMKPNEFFTRQFIREINQKITKVLNKVARQQSNNWYKVANVVSELMNLGLRTKLLTLKQFFDNQISGRQERLIQDIGTMFQKGIDTKELKKLRSKYASLIKDDIKKNAGLYFGEVNSPFLTKSQIEDYINSRKDNQMYHLLVSIALGKSYLEGADSMNKAASTEKFFISMLLKVMTDKTNPNRMTPEDALKFVNEQLTGQKFEDALKESAKIINEINTKAGRVVLSETKENIFRGAMDLVKANLLVGQALDANSLKSAYNAAYKIAGYGLGHESNNLVTTLVNGFQSRIEEQIKKAVKEKQWGKAANLTIIATINRNILNPFVGGGTNWLVLGLQKSGIEPISPLYYMMEKMRNGIDLSTDSGVKKLEETLFDDYRRKTINKRLLIGGISASLITLALFASGGDDEMEEWLKKNEWARKYQTVFVPQLTLVLMAFKNGTLGDWLTETFSKSQKFEKLPKIKKAIEAYNKGDSPEADKAKLYGVIGNVAGSFVDVPLLPVKFARDLGGVYRYIVDKPQEKPDYKNVGFANGFFNYGLIDYLGFRPDRTYMKNMEEYIPESDEKTIKFLRKNDLDINSNSDKAVLSNGIKKSLTEDEAQKYDNAWGSRSLQSYKRSFSR